MWVEEEEPLVQGGQGDGVLGVMHPVAMPTLRRAPGSPPRLGSVIVHFLKCVHNMRS